MQASPMQRLLQWKQSVLGHGASGQEGLAQGSKTSLEFVSERGMKKCLDSVIPNSKASLLILSFHQRVLG